MKPIFNKIWILDQSRSIIFQIPSESNIEFIDKCFSAIEIIAKEIKEDFHVSIINLDKSTISMMKIPFKNTSIYFFGMKNENIIGSEKKIIMSLKKISKIISGVINEENNLVIKEDLVKKLKRFIYKKT